jgi:hypothetical protein
VGIHSADVAGLRPYSTESAECAEYLASIAEYTLYSTESAEYTVYLTSIAEYTLYLNDSAEYTVYLTYSWGVSDIYIYMYPATGIIMGVHGMVFHVCQMCS